MSASIPAGTSSHGRETQEAEDSTCFVELRVAGAWSGHIQAQLDKWTVEELRKRLASVSGISSDSINLICAGKILKDGSFATLRQLGLGCNSKLLITKVAAPQIKHSMLAEEERHCRLTRIKAAADAMVKRSDGNPFTEDSFDMQLENQSGEKLRFNSENDRRALILGLMLHSKARDLLQQNNYEEALEVLAMAEESFALCDSKILEAVDNIPFLQIDVVWCYFMLKDIAKLADAGKRLSQAREGLCHSHGPHLERLRVLQGGFCPELAVYVRLELLEGVVAFHTGRLEAAQTSMLAAQSKYNQLQVADEAVAFLVGMGFSAKEARRALRVSAQDVNSAVEFAMNERRRKLKRQEEDMQLKKARREQKCYGRTASGQPVDLGKLENLLFMGYEKLLAVEALRQADNSVEDALDILTNPLKNTALQCALAPKQCRSRKRVNPRDVNELVDMGFGKEQVIEALQNLGEKDLALDQLLHTANGTSTGTFASSEAKEEQIKCREDNDLSTAGPSSFWDSNGDEESEDGERSTSKARDAEMEEDIAMTLSGDPLAEYDIDVEEEGKALVEYISMIHSRLGS